MSEPVRQLSFSGGEVAPAMYSRTDHVKYDTGLRTLRNMICMRHGGVTMRPGTMFVGEALNSNGEQVRLIPFVFNETGDGQSYVLLFGDQAISFYQNGGVVESSPGVPYQLISPYLSADLQELQFTESADVMTITHPSYAPMELRRLAATNWTLTAITFGSSQGAPSGVNISGTVSGAVIQTYFVTALSATGEESIAASGSSAAGTSPASSTTPITISWTPAAGSPPAYRIYQANNGVGAFIGQINATSFVDDGILPDFNNNPPIENTVFDSSDNYPSTCGFVQQRRAFAATNNNPIGFWLSQPGNYANFNVSTFPKDSDAVIATIAGNEVNEIQSIVEQKFMLVMTSGAEIYVQGNGSGIVTPSAINASVQSQYGKSTIRPLQVADVLLFNQALGSFIRDFAFDFAIDGYRGNDITVFSSHLFEGYSITDWAFQKVPDSIVWAVRSDGVLLSCTYMREQQILAWAHHDLTNGVVENICSIPENGNYAVYVVVRRVIDGNTVRYLERLSSRIWTDPIEATYLDCFSTFDGRNTGTGTMRLTGSGWTYTDLLSLESSGAFFTADMVGDEIFIEDEDGEQIRFVINDFVNAGGVHGYPNRDVPVSLQSVATTSWSHAVKTLSGLDYLEGQEVSVWADRFVVGSPLNTNITSTYTVTGGEITLDKCYAVIYVGLPMVADFQTLDLETSLGETMLAKRKRSGRVNIFTYNSRSMFAGNQNPDTNPDNADDDALFQLDEQMQGHNRLTYDEPPNLQTGQDYITFDTRWNYGGRIFIRNVDPIPLSILAVAPEGEDPSKIAGYKKV